ncbi:unnamed protein product, partial [Mesorhabditis belari]|uniref:BTB domain-containing protein n=1 Tax=Mesorhabditis belari TaxID=2138241 RepID=A0AAF3FLW4_9BILA
MGNNSAKYETATEDDEDTEDKPKRKKTRKGKRKAQNAEPECSSPKKIAKLDTPKYVHEKLFLQGEGSDVAVLAVGHQWNLHKLYLKQCKYFEALFREKSDWKERSENVVKLEFPAGKVTVEALHQVLGSLYSNEITLEIGEIEGILSAASLLQLESLLDRCAEMMCQDIGDDRVLKFLDLAIMYGLPTVIQKVTSFLTINFWRLAKEKKFLAEISLEALARLISSPDTLVMEGEQDLYNIIKTWIYLNQGGQILDDETAHSEALEEFFRRHDSSKTFEPYLALWSGIRLHHLVTSTASMKILELDRIYPKQILKETIVDTWKCMIRNEEDPKLGISITDDVFNLCALRQGRVVDSEPKCWRWTGYNNGIDILLNFSHGILTMKRNCLTQSTPYSVNISSERSVHHRIVFTDANGAQIFDTGRKLVNLSPDLSITVARLDKYKLPISVHLFYLVQQPSQPAFL